MTCNLEDKAPVCIFVIHISVNVTDREIYNHFISLKHDFIFYTIFTTFHYSLLYLVNKAVLETSFLFQGPKFSI